MLGDIDLTLVPQNIEIFLTKPNRTIVAKLNEAYETSVSVRLGGINEISFKIPYKLFRGTDYIDNPHIELIRDRYLLKVVVDSREEWYTIRNIGSYGDEDSNYVPITAYLLPYEMNDKIIGAYQEEALNLYTVLMGGTAIDASGSSRQVAGLLDSTRWSVGYIDGDFITKFRSFDFTSVTVLDAVTQVAETFQAIMIWDTANRKINFWKQENYGIDKGLVLGYGKYLKTVSRESNSDEMTTRLKVEGADGLSIQRLNPSGKPWLDDFTYFLYPFQRDASRNVIQSSYYMSDALCHAILDYNAFVASKQGVFAGYLAQLDTYQTTLARLQFEMATLKEQLAVIKNNIDIENSAGHDTTTPSTIEEQVYIFNLPITFSTTRYMKIFSATKALENIKFSDYPSIDFINSIKVGSTEVFSNDKTKWTTGSYNGKLTIPAGTNITITFKTNYTISSVTSGDKQTFSKIQVKIKDATAFTDILTDGSLVGMSQVSTGISLTTKLNNKNAEITSKQTQISGVNSSITSVQNQITILANSLDSSNFFTPLLQEELTDFIIEHEWTDTNYINDQELYDDAQIYFNKLKEPQIIIDIDIINFLQIVEAQRDWGKLSLGDTITIRYEQIGINAQAKIIGFDIDFENNEIKLTIANTKDIMSDDDKLIKAIYNSTGTSTTVDLSKFKWDKAASTASQVNQVIEGDWDAIKRSIIAGVNNSVEISERGILVKSSTDPLSYLVIQNGVLAITNDNGNTWKHAITKDGIIGERIFGKLLAGVNLVIDASNASGTKTFTVDSTGVKILGTSLTITGGLPPSQLDPSFKDSLVNLGTVYNGIVINTANGLVATRSDGTARAIFNATSGMSFQKNVSGTWTDQFYYDVASGNLVLNGQLNAKSIKINGNEVIAGNFLSGNMIDKLSVSKLDVSTAKITTAMIETLTVGQNVIMGPSAVISWSQVSGAPTGSWVNPSYITSTKITSTTIESPTITAANIVGGTISAGTTINVGTDLTVGNNINLGPSTNARKTITFNSGAFIQSLNSTEIKISAQTTYIWDGTVNIGNSNTSVYRTNFYGLVDFSSATLVGVKAVFA